MMRQHFLVGGVLSVVAGFAFRSAFAVPPDVHRRPETDNAIQYEFSSTEIELLDEVQHASFLYFWNEVGTPAQLVKDRKKAPVSSSAAIGFQLSSLPIGVEHNWITREQGRQRAAAILSSLIAREDNKRRGIYVHFPDLNTGGPSHAGYEVLASTVDTALLIAGAIPAGEYFGGEVKALVLRLVEEANWRAYVAGPDGYISMGWKPEDPANLGGDGEFLDWCWTNASDEERLVYFLACGSPQPAHAIDPRLYFRLGREIKGHGDLPPYAVSWPGAMFTYFFSHCWIDYRSLGADDPSRLGVDAPRIDWFENSRRAVVTHRQRCVEQAGRFKTLAPDRWGLSACAGRDGYIVPEIQPNLSGADRWHEGTVAPYVAASSIMFAPRLSMAALRAFRQQKGPDGKPFVWRDPADGGYGFVDAFNLDQGYASDDYVGIDHGPMLLSIENARTGLVWRLFMQNDMVRKTVARLRLEPDSAGTQKPATPAKPTSRPNPN